MNMGQKLKWWIIFCTSWVANVLRATFISREITIIIITEGALHECGLEAKFCILVASVVHNLHFKRHCYHYHCRKVHWRQLRSRSGAQILTRGCILSIAKSFKHIYCIVLPLPSFSSGNSQKTLLQRSTV
jgi:hypothetical protein